MFTDFVKLKLIAGKGGNGVVAWRREKCVTKGGPEGGNGGDGGAVVFQCDENLISLEDLRKTRFVKAEDGGQGGNQMCHGKQGKQVLVKVPCGTQIRNVETGEVLQDMTEHKQRWVACKGGWGGRGNATFATATNRAPIQCTMGREGECIDVELELKLIADVGLVGFPNAGKSTLISALADVRVKIAPYPFTTLSPNLAYVEFEDYRRALIADIPGIIAGASDNRGLGIEFLRHIERTKMLIFVLDASGIDGRTALEDYKTLVSEIQAYSPEVLEKPAVIVLNKMDANVSPLFIDEFLEAAPAPNTPVYVISALERQGLDVVLDKIHETLFRREAQQAEQILCASY